MATRKIRLTLSGTKVENQGPVVDIDFNGENLDADVDVNAVYGESTIVKEYTVDVISGTYNLDINFKNDANVESNDRNLYIESIEYANNGINYESLIVNASNTNLLLYTNFPQMGWLAVPNDSYDPNLPRGDGNRPRLENPTYNPSEPRTDDDENEHIGYTYGLHPGNNPKFQYNFVIHPIKIWQSGTSTFNIAFN